MSELKDKEALRHWQATKAIQNGKNGALIPNAIPPFTQLGNETITIPTQHKFRIFFQEESQYGLDLHKLVVEPLSAKRLACSYPDGPTVVYHQSLTPRDHENTNEEESDSRISNKLSPHFVLEDDKIKGQQYSHMIELTGDKLACFTDQNIDIWNIKLDLDNGNKRLLKSVKLSDDIKISAVDALSDELLALGTNNGDIQIYSISEGACLYTINARDMENKDGHPILTITSISPSEMLVAYRDKDNIVTCQVTHSADETSLSNVRRTRCNSAIIPNTGGKETVLFSQDTSPMLILDTNDYLSLTDLNDINNPEIDVESDKSLSINLASTAHQSKNVCFFRSKLPDLSEATVYCGTIESQETKVTSGI